MKITIVSGSHRDQSQSLKVAKFIQSQLAQLSVTADVVDLGNNPLPLWSEEAWDGESSLTKAFVPYSQKLKDSVGFVFVVPEWGGMVLPAFKNFMLLCNKNELAHKAAMIVAVSSGRGGSYPVVELRTCGYKNTHICYTPEHIIVQNVENVLNHSSEVQSKDDQYIRDRLVFALNVLKEYSNALSAVRETGLCFNKNYPYGM